MRIPSCFRKLQVPVTTWFLVLAVGASSALTTRAQQRTVVAVVDAGETHAPISPHLYGHFLEHGGEEPDVNAGSPTFPLDAAAAWTAGRTALTVAVVNPTETAQPLDLKFENASLTGSGTRWRMAPESLDARIIPGQKPAVEVEEEAVRSVPGLEPFAPFSVTLYHLEAR